MLGGASRCGIICNLVALRMAAWVMFKTPGKRLLQLVALCSGAGGACWGGGVNGWWKAAGWWRITRLLLVITGGSLVVAGVAIIWLVGVDPQHRLLSLVNRLVSWCIDCISIWRWNWKQSRVWWWQRIGWSMGITNIAIITIMVIIIIVYGRLLGIIGHSGLAISFLCHVPDPRYPVWLEWWYWWEAGLTPLLMSSLLAAR